MALGTLGASLALAAAADVGASAAARPKHGSVGSLPIVVVEATLAASCDTGETAHGNCGVMS